MHTAYSDVSSTLKGTNRHVFIKIKMRTMSFINNQKNIIRFANLSYGGIICNKPFHVWGSQVDNTDLWILIKGRLNLLGCYWHVEVIL